MRAVLWVPGRFSLTNKMLDNLRAGSRYQGARPPRGWVNAFEQETQAIRLATKAAARNFEIECLGLLDVWVTVLGHHKHDPDAWLLLGKAAVDGLVDAGVMLSDRQDLYSVGGRVTATRGEDDREWTAAFGGSRKAYSSPGFLLSIGTLAGRCGHA